MDEPKDKQRKNAIPVMKPNPVTVQEKAQVRAGCKNVYDKCHFCTFCEKMVKGNNIARHLLKWHTDSPRVYDVVCLAKRSEERLFKLEMLANEGNFKHNIKVIKEGKGVLVVARRSGVTSSQKYLPCEDCLKFFLKSSLSVHHNNCKARKYNNIPSDVGEKNAVRRSKHLLYGALYDMESEFLSSLLERMRDDDVKMIVEEDELIRRYGCLKVESLGSKDDQKVKDIHRVSQGCRSLARLVLLARTKKPNITLNALIRPENFDLVVRVTKELAYEKENPALSLGRYMGNLIGHIIMVKTGYSLRIGNDALCAEAEKFKKLLDSEWNARVNAYGTKRRNTIKRRNPILLPSTEDLITFNEYLTKGIQHIIGIAEESITPGDWSDLSKLAMTRLIIFNKRRPHEVTNLEKVDYEDRSKWKTSNREMMMALTKSEKLLHDRYSQKKLETLLI